MFSLVCVNLFRRVVGGERGGGGWYVLSRSCQRLKILSRSCLKGGGVPIKDLITAC